MMRRDPRTDPQEGDVLYQANGTRELHVDKVDSEEIGYRVTDGHGGLLGAYRTPLLNWRESAPYTCDESEMFCPSCDGRGDECKGMQHRKRKKTRVTLTCGAWCGNSQWVESFEVDITTSGHTDVRCPCGGTMVAS